MKGVISRGGKYVARPTHDGRKVWLGTFDCEEQAEAAIVAWRSQGRVQKDSITVDLLASIYRVQKVEHLSAATQGNYGRAVTAFCAEFGGREIHELHKIEIQGWANTVPSDYLRTIRTMFEWGKSMDVVTENPTAGVLPRPKPRKRMAMILAPEQVFALAETALEVTDEPEAHIVSAHIIFAAFTGMRPGEIAALRWRDIDYACDEIHVQHSITIGQQEKAPKNGLDRRIVLTPEARQALATLDPAAPESYIFQLPDGQLLVKANLHRYFDRIRRAFGMPGLVFYDLRHTCATNLLTIGIPSFVVAVQLGHTDNGRLVETTYGHPSDQAALDQIKRATRVAGHSENQRIRVAPQPATGGKTA